MDKSLVGPALKAELASLQQHHGLSHAWASVLEEAARVCLASQGHHEYARLSVYGDRDEVVEIIYERPNELAVRNNADENKATEHGACALAILLCRLLKGHAVVTQASQLDGIDYWVGDEEDGKPMNMKARLEATGIRQGDRKAVKKRFQNKLKTTSKSDGALPAIIAVVEFSNPLAQMETKRCTQ